MKLKTLVSKSLWKITASFLFITLVTELHAQETKYRPNIVVVKYSNAKAAANREAQFESLCNAKTRRANRMFAVNKKDSVSAGLNRIYMIEYDGDESPIMVARKLAQSEDVEYAEPYWIPKPAGKANDPMIGQQYYLSLTKTLEAHNITQGNSDIVIGIVDQGVDVRHEDLVNNIKLNTADPINGIDDDGDGYTDNYRGWDLGEDDNNPINREDTHGTKVAGIACATTNNGKGIASVGYKTKFLPIKVSDEDGELTAGYEGIVYAADHGCKIINCSWVSGAKSQMNYDVVRYAQDRGCLIVASAGNFDSEYKLYPASYDGVLSVCATNSADEKCQFSSYNHSVDIAAPGEEILTTDNDNLYNTDDGTSFAAPIVSGAAALVWAARPNLTAVQVAELLRVTADNIDNIPANAPYRGKLGSGRINVLRALTDSTSPSIRITNYTFSASNNDSVLQGQTIGINIGICNYLEKAKNVTITLEPTDKCTNVSGSYHIDSISTMQSIDSLTFTVSISDTLSYNANVPLRFKFKADGYSASQTLDLSIDPVIADIEWGQMQTTIADNGKIGIYEFDDWNVQGRGFSYKDDNLIMDGALVFALNDSKIASAIRKDNQFAPFGKKSEKVVINGVTHFKSSIRPKNIDDIEIIQDYIFDDENLPTAMICDYAIVCSRNVNSQNAALGIYFNWDILGSIFNKIEYDAKRQLAYVYNADDLVSTFFKSNPRSGICLISKGNPIPFAIEENKINFRKNLTNEQKWLVMNEPHFESAAPDTNDIAMMLTCNNITIKPNDTVKVTFAVLAADNLNELKRTAEKAIELYGDKEKFVFDNTSDKPAANAIHIYPNPAKSTIYIENNNPISTVRIYSANGVLEVETNVSGTSAAIGVSQIADGLHIVEIISTDGRTERRLVVK